MSPNPDRYTPYYSTGTFRRRQSHYVIRSQTKSGFMLIDRKKWTWRGQIKRVSCLVNVLDLDIPSIEECIRISSNMNQLSQIAAYFTRYQDERRGKDKK